MVSALGAMGPISLASAINPVAGVALSGLNTAGRTSREALEAGNATGAALGYGLVAGSIDFTLNAVAGKAFQARGQKGWGNEFVSRVAKTKGGDVALRTIAGTLVDTGADTFSLIAQHNLRKMYNPSYEGKLDEGEIFKTIAVSLVMNGGMRLGSNLGGVYESNADGTLKPLEEAKLMGQLGGELEGPDRLKPKEVEAFQEMELEGDESGGLSELFRDVEADRPVVETGGVEVEAKPSGAKADKISDISLEESDIIKNTLNTMEAEELAFDAIQGRDNVDSVMLGKYEGGSPDSYERVAQDYGSQYFQMEQSIWDEMSIRYSREEMWKINEKFLDIQIASGRDIYLSHNPDSFRYTKTFFSDEISYLERHGFKFVQEGDVWHAVFK